MARKSSGRRACAVAMLAVACAFAPGGGAASAADASRLKQRVAPEKPDRAVVPPGHSQRRLHVKFDEGTEIRLRGSRLVTLGTDPLGGVRQVFADFPGLRVERLFDRPESRLEAEKAAIERKSGREQADLNLWYRLLLPPKTDAADVIDRFNALGIVEIAYAEPQAAPPPSHSGPTPDFSGGQAYSDAAPDGIDADFAHTVPGGTGANVRIIDIEYSWNTTHEDLAAAAAPGAMVPNKTASDPFSSNDHGTAVLGELIATDNGFGVTGLAHGAAIGMTNANNAEDGYDLADSINIASAALAPGDAILLEQQISGPNGCNNGVSGCVAVEWVQAYYDAIVNATSNGRIVVEAAGNGGEDLDDTATYGDPFPSGRADSGAIIVGSANYPGCTNPTHGRRPSSTYGARVNFHAYGQCVTTTGYGALQTDPSPDFWYTDAFNGTSSASPIVTSAAAILSSIAQAQGDANGLTSAEARTMLATGATPQDTTSDTNPVGPMPDLRDALAAYLPTADAGGAYATAEGTDVALDGAGSDPQGGVTYDWDLDDDGTFETSGQDPTFTRVGRDGSFEVTLRVTDGSGATTTDSATVTVTNVAPSVTVGTDAPRDEGAPVTASGAVSDPGFDDPLSATVDWGDGSPVEPISGPSEDVRPEATLAYSGQHRYGDNGAYVVEVCGSDDDTTRCRSSLAVVDNVAPSVTVDPAQDAQIDEGDTVQTSASFSDPGWLDAYTGEVTWGTAAFAPSAAAVLAADQRPAPDTGTATSSKRYGDDGTYTVTTAVTDDDGGAGSDAFALQVANVPPTAAIDLAGTTVINGTPTVLAEAGEPVPFAGRSQDPGSDDLFLSWNWDDGPPAPDVTTPYLVAPPAADPPASPQVDPRDVTDARSHAFGQACLYDVGFGSRDDDAGSAADTVRVLITGTADQRRTVGYWSQQYKAGGQHLDAATLACYLEVTGFLSTVFDEQRDASTPPKAYQVLSSNAAQARAKLDRQLLAALLNFANGSVGWNEPVEGTPFSSMITTAEAVRSNPASTNAELLTQKDALERFNLSHGG